MDIIHCNLNWFMVDLGELTCVYPCTWGRTQCFPARGRRALVPGGRLILLRGSRWSRPTSPSTSFRKKQSQKQLDNYEILLLIIIMGTHSQFLGIYEELHNENCCEYSPNAIFNVPFIAKIPHTHPTPPLSPPPPVYPRNIHWNFCLMRLETVLSSCRLD